MKLIEVYAIKHPKKSLFGVLGQTENEELFILKKKFKTELEARNKCDLLEGSIIDLNDWEPADIVSN